MGSQKKKEQERQLKHGVSYPRNTTPTHGELAKLTREITAVRSLLAYLCGPSMGHTTSTAWEVDSTPKENMRTCLVLHVQETGPAIEREEKVILPEKGNTLQV